MKWIITSIAVVLSLLVSTPLIWITLLALPILMLFSIPILVIFYRLNLRVKKWSIWNYSLQNANNVKLYFVDILVSKELAHHLVTLLVVSYGPGELFEDRHAIVTKKEGNYHLVVRVVQNHKSQFVHLRGQ
ncbi:MAG: hypothetical protein R2827_00030 [Bdellovibrionales bacterium]